MKQPVYGLFDVYVLIIIVVNFNNNTWGGSCLYMGGHILLTEFKLLAFRKIK